MPHLPRQNLLPSGLGGALPPLPTSLFRIVGLVYLILIQETWSSNLPRGAMTLSSEAERLLYTEDVGISKLSVSTTWKTHAAILNMDTLVQLQSCSLSMLSCLDFLEKWQSGLLHWAWTSAVVMSHPSVQIGSSLPTLYPHSWLAPTDLGTIYFEVNKNSGTLMPL